MRILTGRRSIVAAVIAGATCIGAVLPAAPASADTYNDVNVSIPSSIVLDGSPIAVTVTSTRLTGYSDRVTLVLYNGASLQTYDTVGLNKQVTIADTTGIEAGTLIGRSSGATTYCSWVYDDYCSLDDDLNWYTFVTGLSYHDSTPAVAKYGSKLELAAVNDGTRTTWTATAQRYGGYSWKPWTGAAVTIGSTVVTADVNGIATWIEQTPDLHTYPASVAESAAVWGTSVAAVTPTLHLTPVVTPPTKPSPPASSSRPGHVTASSSASKTASAMKKGLPHVRKVVPLTKKNDVNKLLGRKKGYISAAVLYDRRITCSDGPGVDCGATIEKFTSTAKAKARSKHIQALLRKYRFLGTEYDTVHGHFLLRVSGDLTKSQAAAYKRTFAKVF